MDIASSEREVEAVPPRFWWLKRLGAAGVLLLIGLVCTFFLCQWWETRRANWLLAGMHIPGQPPVLSSRRALPDSENAAIHLKKAAAQLTPTDEERNLFINYGHPAEKERIIAKFAPVLAEVRATRGQSQADWGSPPESGDAFDDLIMPQVDVADFLWHLADHLHETGRDAEAIAYLNDLERMGRLIGENMPTMQDRVHQIDVEASVRALQLLLPKLNLSTPDARKTAQAMIADLMDEEIVVRFAANTAAGSGLEMMDNARSLELLFLRPIVMRSVADNMEQLQSWLDRVESRSPAEVRRLKEMLVSAEKNAGAAAPDSDMISPRDELRKIADWDPMLYRYLEWMAMREVAGTGLAIRLYQAEHGGRLPASLEALVPKYLPRVPCDPLHSDGRTFAYIQGEKPAVFSTDASGARPDTHGTMEIAIDLHNDSTKAK